MSAPIPALLLALAWLLQSDREAQKGPEPEEGIEAEETELPGDMVRKLAPPGEGKDSGEEEEVEAGEDFVLLDSVPAAYALFAVTEDGNLQRWDVGQHSLQYSVRPLVDSVIGLCRSLDGKSLLYADRLSSIAVLDAVTGETVEVAFVDQGYTGESAAKQAQAQGIRLEVVKLPEAKKGFVLLPRRWVVERTFGWLGRFRRLARDYERLATALAGWHWLASLTLLLNRLALDSA